MTQVTSGIGSPTQMEVNPLSVLSPTEIKQFNDAREGKALVDWVLSNYKQAKSTRSRVERQWGLNMAFYTGKQNLTYLPAKSGAGAGKLVNAPAPSYVSRKVTNRIRPIIRTEIARLISNKPNASVVPASSEDADLFAAQAGEQVWESIYNSKKIHKVFGRSMFWMTICGTSFMKCWWDPQGYDELTKQEGTLRYGAVTPYHLYVPDMYEEEIEEQPWVINAYTKTAEWVEATYQLKVDPSTQSAVSPLESAMFVLGTNDAKKDSVLVLECWLKPHAHKLFPTGGYITIVDTTIVAISDTFYNHKEYPFTKFDHIPTGMFYAESIITDLIDPQREYNRTKNQIIEAKNRMAKPQLTAPKGSIDASKVTSAPGQIIFYRPGLAPPTPITLQPLPSYVLQELEREVIDMEDISSQHAVSRGGAPAGVTAATAISFLQERDDSLLTTAYQSIEFGWEKIAKQTLSHVVQFWDVQRTVSVTGLDGSFDAIVLKGTELSTGTDIRIEAGSALPTSKAAKQAFLLDMMKMGFIDPSKGLELMDMGGIDKLYDELKVDERAAQRENLRMSKLEIEQILQHEQMTEMANQQAMMQEQMMQEQMGPVGMDPMADPMADPMGMEQPPPPEGPPGPGGMDPNTATPLQLPMNMVPVNTWDNHQLHIDVHNRYRKTQAFELQTPEVKTQFEYHVAMHAMVLNQAAQAAMMQPPPPEGGLNADNGSGSPVGSNQFGPPGTSDGAPPPPSDSQPPPM